MNENFWDIRTIVFKLLVQPPEGVEILNLSSDAKLLKIVSFHIKLILNPHFYCQVKKYIFTVQGLLFTENRKTFIGKKVTLKIKFYVETDNFKQVCIWVQI